MSCEEENFRLIDDKNTEETTQDWGLINRQAKSIDSNHYSSVEFDECLPKGFEKYFDQDGSETQQLRLNYARDQMYLALLHVRGHHTKHLLEGVWIETQNRAFIAHAKGSFFRDMGSPHVYCMKRRIQGLWLTGVEAVYLAERGSLIMYLGDKRFLEFMTNDSLLFDYKSLTHISLAHLHSIAFGVHSDIFDEYKVFSLLKRLGYLVMDYRTFVPHHEPIVPMKKHTSIESFVSPVRSLLVNIGSISRKLCSWILRECDQFLDYTQIFRSIGLKSSNTLTEMTTTPHTVDPTYRIIFNVWKPSANFSKKYPPWPNFQLGILNTSKTPFPKLSSIQRSWEQLNLDLNDKGTKVDKKATVNQKSTRNLQGFKQDIKLRKTANRESKIDPRLHERNNYFRTRDILLKQGSTGRSTIFAIIDNGVVNFAIFSEIDFELNTCAKHLNQLENRRSHGILWNERLDI